MVSFRGFRAGEIVDERYEIIDTIGQGGFGVVYRARQIAIDRVVALKVLLPEADTVDPQAVERFRREAVLISSLESSNTITLYEFGQTNEGMLYTVMEFARGETLRQMLAREGHLQPNRVIHIVKQILQSLFEAHQRGIVHRDLKPANIMVGEYAGQQDHVKVLDFGIAKILKSGDTQSTLALTGRIVGTPRYMAPEQLRGVNPTPAADLYAVALIIYELFTGRPAVTASDPMEQVQAQMRPQSFALPANTPGVAPGLLNVVNRALDKEPANRYQSADVFSRALQGATQISVPSSDAAKTKHIDQNVIRAHMANQGAHGQGHPQHGHHARPIPHKKSSGLGIFIVFAAVFFLAALGMVAFLLVSSGGEDDDEGSSRSDTGSQVETDTGSQVETDTGSPPPPELDAGQAQVDTASEPDAGSVPDPDGGTASAPDTESAESDATAAAPDAEEAEDTSAPPERDTGAAVEADTAAPEPDQHVAAVDAGQPEPEDTGESEVQVGVEIVTDPSRARVYYGDESCRTPCVVPVPADGSSLRVRIRRTGYTTVTRTVSSSDSPQISVPMRRAEEPDAIVLELL